MQGDFNDMVRGVQRGIALELQLIQINPVNNSVL